METTIVNIQLRHRCRTSCFRAHQQHVAILTQRDPNSGHGEKHIIPHFRQLFLAHSSWFFCKLAEDQISQGWASVDLDFVVGFVIWIPPEAPNSALLKMGTP